MAEDEKRPTGVEQEQVFDTTEEAAGGDDEALGDAYPAIDKLREESDSDRNED